MNNELQKDIFACEMLEVKYCRLNGLENKMSNLDYSLIFPPDWFNVNDYKKRIEILIEAIEKGIKIIETDKYLDICEGVSRDINHK